MILQKIVAPFAFVFAILNELRFLARTDAPGNVFISYISNLRSNMRLYGLVGHYKQKYAAQFSKLTLSTDWFTHNIPFWIELIDRHSLRERSKLEVLEIGSWEGLSSYFILDSLPNARLTCVDTWEGGDEHQSDDLAGKNRLMSLESVFDKNMAAYASRMKKYKGTSQSYYAHRSDDSKFDLIYVDGSHRCDDVIVDAVRCFELLNEGGVMIFDDYFWQYYANHTDNPASAINHFLQLKKGSYRIIRTYYQIAIEKIARAER